MNSADSGDSVGEKVGVITTAMKISSQGKTIGLALIKRRALTYSKLQVFEGTREVELFIPKGFALLEGRGTRLLRLGEPSPRSRGNPAGRRSCIAP